MSYTEDYVSRLNRLRSDRDLLAQLVAQPVNRPAVSKTELANLILKKARSDFSVGEPPSYKKETGVGHSIKSVGLGILDILSRPLYGAANAVDTAVNEGGNPLKGAWEGISGKEKNTFIDVLQHRNPELNDQDSSLSSILSPLMNASPMIAGLPALKAIDKAIGEPSIPISPNVVQGLAADFILDPLNAVGVGPIKKGIDLVKGAKALKKSDELVDAGEAIAQQTPAQPQPEALQSLPTPETVASPEAQKALVIENTEPIVDQLAKGNPAASEFLAPKVEPMVPVTRKATEIAVERIIREIDEAIPDPIKARAAGKQPRHPIFNSPTQSNLSNKLTVAAKNLFKAKTAMNASKGVTNAASPKFIPTVYDTYIRMLRNAEETLVAKGIDKYMPRGGIKSDSPYLRLSDVLDRLPVEVARKAILGPNPSDKVHPSVLLRAVTGDKQALTTLRKSPEVYQAVTSIDWTPVMTREYALRVVEATNKVDTSVAEASQFIDELHTSVNSDVVKAQATEDIVDKTRAEFKNEMPEAKATLNDILKDLKRPVTLSPVEEAIQRTKYKTAAAVTGGKNAQHIAQAPRIEASANTTADILKSEFDDIPDGLSPKQISQTAATDAAKAAVAGAYAPFSTILSWIKPDAGYKELRPLALKNISARRSSATTRAHHITQILNSVPEKEHKYFWNEVRGVLPVSLKHSAAVDQMQKMIGNLFGESGILEKFAGNTAISRSGIPVAHLNKHIRIAGIKDFHFISQVKDPTTGKLLDLDGPEILQSWRSYIPENEDALRKFVFGLTQGVENAMVEYSTFANVGAIWGSKVSKEGFIKVTDMHPAIDDMYFPKDIVSQLGALARGIDEFHEPIGSSGIMRLYDDALRTWKTGVTIYAPSHHIRNMIGDVFLAWLDGVSNPIYYKRAAQVLKANYHRYSDIKDNALPLQDLLGSSRETEIIAEILGQTQKKMPSGNRVIARVRAGNKSHKVTINQVYQMAFRQGLLPHSSVIEDLPGSETLMERLADRFHPGKAGPFQPFKGKVASGARKLSESREHYARMAHYLYAIEHTKGRDLEEVFRKAADRVRKYHPDGLDLTNTEKRVFRRLFPFYSWTRKAIPLVVEGIVTNPAKIMAYPKLMSGIQESQGIDSNVSNPWPEDQLFPDWLNGNVIGPVLSPSSAFAKAIARSDDETGYTVINPGNPATDIMEDFFNNPVKGIGNMVTPGIKIPAELAFNTEYLTGAPIQDKTEYIDKNIPMLATASRLTHGALGTGLLEGGDLRGKETEPYNIPGLINYLTAAGIIDTGRYEKSAEFDLKKRLTEEKKKQNGS